MSSLTEAGATGSNDKIKGTPHEHLSYNTDMYSLFSLASKSGQYCHAYSVAFDSTALIPAKWIISRGTSADYCFRRHNSFLPRQICTPIHNLHCSKALTKCANPTLSGSSCMPFTLWMYFCEIFTLLNYTRAKLG